MNTTKKMTPVALLGQVLLYVFFAGLIGIFSRWPVYRPIAPDQALIKLSFTHHGKPVSECRQASAAELAKLPPNMRAPMRCPRERSPVRVELDIDGVVAYRHQATPSGLSKDGPSSVYHRFQVPAGSHHIAVRLNDDARKPQFTHVREANVALKPAQILVIDFDAEKGGVTFQ